MALTGVVESVELGLLAIWASRCHIDSYLLKKFFFSYIALQIIFHLSRSFSLCQIPTFQILAKSSLELKQLQYLRYSHFWLICFTSLEILRELNHQPSKVLKESMRLKWNSSGVGFQTMIHLWGVWIFSGRVQQDC